jgi:hypothetical protein
MNTPIHIISCYLAPYLKDEIRMTVNRIKFILVSLFSQCRQFRVILLGDFNFLISDIQEIAKMNHLKEVIEEGVATHIEGID